MTILHLLRHAHSNWPKPGQTDFERQLSASGRLQAKKINGIILDGSISPDVVLCSTANRCVETMEIALKDAVEEKKLVFVDALYESTAKIYKEVLAKHANLASIMLIGHNPAIEELLMDITKDDNQNVFFKSGCNFPPAGFAKLEVLSHAPLKSTLKEFLTFEQP